MVRILLRWNSLIGCVLYMCIVTKAICTRASHLISLLELNCLSNKLGNVQ